MKSPLFDHPTKPPMKYPEADTLPVEYTLSKRAFVFTYPATPPTIFVPDTDVVL